jgi:hypothetical protein
MLRKHRQQVIHTLFFTRRTVAELETALRLLERYVADNARELAELRKSFEGSTPAALAARIDDLAAAIEVTRATHRRELGKVWGTLGGGRGDAGDPPAQVPTDAEFEALIALQNAHGGH